MKPGHKIDLKSVKGPCQFDPIWYGFGFFCVPFQLNLVSYKFMAGLSLRMLSFTLLNYVLTIRAGPDIWKSHKFVTPLCKIILRKFIKKIMITLFQIRPWIQVINFHQVLTGKILKTEWDDWLNFSWQKQVRFSSVAGKFSRIAVTTITKIYY